MNRKQAVRRARAYLREPKTATWLDAQIEDLLDEAQTEVFYELVTSNAPIFMHFKEVTWEQNVREYKQSVLFGANVAEFRAVLQKCTSGPVSRTNTMRAMMPLHEAKQLGWTPYGYVSSFVGEDDLGIAPTYTYLVTGNRMILSPVPTTTIYLGVEAVFEPNPLVADETEIWDGELSQFHYIVAIKAAMNALVQTGDENVWQQFGDRYSKAFRIMQEYLSMTKQTQENYVAAWVPVEG